jgi:prephenate dehydrogenase
MTTVRSAGVVGLGLIGGSIARDLSALGVRVLAYDRDAATLEMACGAGVVDEVLDASLAGLDAAEIVIVAVPVSAARDVLVAAAHSLTRTRLVTDVGSTKRSVVAAAQATGIGERFVGSHPMAGHHQSGWVAAREGLFVGATVYLCPTPSTHADSVALAHELWRVLGARPQIIDAEAHDRRIAYASHLPQAVSTALALTLAGAAVNRDELGDGGRDTTRLAGGSVEMWTAIAADNADGLLPAVEALGAQLERLRTALAQRDDRALRGIFTAAREWFDRDGR